MPDTALNPVPTPVSDCFALLDDCDASPADPRSRLYTGHVGTLNCDNAEGLPDLLVRMECELQRGRHAVGMFNYELGAQIAMIADRQDMRPMAEVLLFEHCEHMDSAQVEHWLAERDAGAPAGIAAVRANVTDAEFMAAIARIHAYIEAGDTYQINYTYRLHFDSYGEPLSLYRRLRARQPVPYGALLSLPDGQAVLSLSPELFVRHAQGLLRARPMKGTAAATGDAGADAARAAALAADAKSRAENLMIVDLLRNDLGRVSRFGSVRVPRLFSVDRYSSVLQMTSTVESQLREDMGLPELFAALYPCGSITGAPKRRTMQIIRELEPDARGLYTGAIGWFDAPAAGRKIGDFCLSVPIRTLVLQAPVGGAPRRGVLGVGAGIVHDSVAGDELEECRLKARFLTGLPQNFELFETMYATRSGGCRHLDLHLQRLRASAGYFGFEYDEEKLRAMLQQACLALGNDDACRMRLTLRQDGDCQIHHATLAPLVTPVTIFLASTPTNSADIFLRHKSSLRSRYDQAWREAEAKGGFDMLFCNERGEVTEGARSNLFVRIDGQWITPPQEAGLLPGIMRAVLLGDPAWEAVERTLTRDDLYRAEEIVVCNALRGVLPACLG